MKVSHIIKSGILLLLIIFTLQVTGMSCVGEDISLNANVGQGECQLKAPCKDDVGNTHSGALFDKYHCPCHLSFSQSPSETIAYYQTIELLSVRTGVPSIKGISVGIFQPPRVFI